MSAARSFLRSASRQASAAASRSSTGPKPMPSAFRTPKRSPMSNLIFRSPVELSCCVETMLPYHTATASALLNSKLSVSRRSWILQGCIDDDC